MSRVCEKSKTRKVRRCTVNFRFTKELSSVTVLNCLLRSLVLNMFRIDWPHSSMKHSIDTVTNKAYEQTLRVPSTNGAHDLPISGVMHLGVTLP